MDNLSFCFFFTAVVDVVDKWLWGQCAVKVHRGKRNCLSKNDFFLLSCHMFISAFDSVLPNTQVQS